MEIPIKRHEYNLNPDISRVVCNYFSYGNEERIIRIANRVSGLNEKESEKEYNRLLRDFSPRHKNFTKLIESNYQNVAGLLSDTHNFSDLKKQLIGAYFSSEYSFEAAALMNPSMVPGQTSDTFVLSLRQVGEGHISSIGFRNGTIDKAGNISVENASVYAQLPQVDDQDPDIRLHFDEDSLLSERIVFPTAPDECNGMEDARFVKFEDDKYYATFTAYDGHKITIKMLVTTDFLNFTVKKLYGKGVNNKGMALFPEKIDGKFAMIARQDGENLYYMISDKIDHWEDASLIAQPLESWEFVQIGNCGSPMRTDQGWILLTHAVGAMRQYIISAYLLDLNDPAKIIGRLKDPLIIPDESEREGYVPNVVYTCGGMIHNGELFIPYAKSDHRSGFASIGVDELVNEMRS